MLRGSSYTGGGGGGIGLPASGVLKQSAVPASVTGTVSETTLATIAVPAGAMGLNGAIQIISRWTFNNTANNKTLRVKFAGTDFLGYSATNSATGEILTIIQNRGVANSQIGDRLAVSGALGTTTANWVTSAIDTTVSQNITLTATLANTGETITLESYQVQILNP